MDQVIRCISERDYTAIKNRNFARGGERMSVKVYYGFNNYNDDPSHIRTLAHIASTETHVCEKDMHVHRVSREESIRHADHTMVTLIDSVEKVANNLDAYTVL